MLCFMRVLLGSVPSVGLVAVKSNPGFLPLIGSDWLCWVPQAPPTPVRPVLLAAKAEKNTNKTTVITVTAWQTVRLFIRSYIKFQDPNTNNTEMQQYTHTQSHITLRIRLIQSTTNM